MTQKVNVGNRSVGAFKENRPESTASLISVNLSLSVHLQVCFLLRVEQQSLNQTDPFALRSFKTLSSSLCSRAHISAPSLVSDV